MSLQHLVQQAVIGVVVACGVADKVLFVNQDRAERIDLIGACTCLFGIYTPYELVEQIQPWGDLQAATMVNRKEQRGLGDTNLTLITLNQLIELVSRLSYWHHFSEIVNDPPAHLRRRYLSGPDPPTKDAVPRAPGAVLYPNLPDYVKGPCTS